MAATLLIGGEDRDSAKRRRKEEYRQDLELQMREKDAARQRERLQGMSVNASGWLDPEKRPDRFKPLGGVHWTETRGRKNDRVKPYHTLFLYGREDEEKGDPAGDPIEPVRTYAGAGPVPNQSVDQAYNFFATRDLGYGPGGGGGGSIVQPISYPYVDNRPIIVTGQNSGSGYQGPRFNPFDHRGDDGHARELRQLLDMTQAEKDRIRRDNDDFQRRLLRELEDERRKLNDQESDARRRMEQLRNEAEERRKEAERQRREAERLKKEAETRPKSNPIRPSSKTMLYYDMNDYRKQLIDERKKIEALLKAAPPKKDVWDVQVVKKPQLRLPPTPKSADRANRDNVKEFNNLKYRDFNARNQFRSVYPDVPMTNRRLEQQQEALLRYQESTLTDQAFDRRSPRQRSLELPPRRAISRPIWLDRNPTPFPHVLKKRDKMYTAQSWDGDLDRIHRRNEERDNYLGNASSRNEEEVLDQLKLRRHRSPSADTLTDDTWLRPSSTAEV